MVRLLSASAIALTSSVKAGWTLDNGLARTPPMGWSTFNHWQGNFNESIFKASVDAIAKSGLPQV
jgi:alpha-galactosidase